MSVAPHAMGVAALSRALAEGAVSSVEVVAGLLEGIVSGDAGHAFLAHSGEHALREAAAADARRARGEAGPLTGVPVAHKDIFVTDFERSGLPSTAGSRMLAGYASAFDATVVARLGDGDPRAGDAAGRRERGGGVAEGFGANEKHRWNKGPRSKTLRGVRLRDLAQKLDLAVGRSDTFVRFSETGFAYGNSRSRSISCAAAAARKSSGRHVDPLSARLPTH